jgi:hypothetical protein
VPRPLTAIAACIVAILIAAASASAATLDRDPLFGTANVALDDGSVTSLFGYADRGGDQLRVAVRAAAAGPCAASAAADPGPLQVDTLVTDEYSVDVPLSATVGAQLFCAWLERGGAEAATPVSVAFNVVLPFAEVKLGTPVVVHRGLPFTLGLLARSDGPARRVFGSLIPGAVCPPTFGATPGGIPAFPPAGLSLLSTKDQATVALTPAPGSYRLCAWVQPSAAAAPEAAAGVAVTVPARRTRTKTENGNWVNKHGTARGVVFVDGAIRGTVVIQAASDVVGSPWFAVKRFAIARWHHKTLCRDVCELAGSDHHVHVRVPVGFNVRARFLGTADAAPSTALGTTVMPW